MKSKFVLDFCDKEDLIKNGRCCTTKTMGTNSSAVIRGLDYSQCDIDHLTNSMRSVLATNESLWNVTILDITANVMVECDYEAYSGLLGLNELYLPSMCDCPGGNYSWLEMANNSCIEQRQICTSNFTNTACTLNSHCVEDGPGNFLCLCNEGYHGYKCYDQGEFPKLLFTLLVCGSGLFLCAILWTTQRRLIVKEE